MASGSGATRVRGGIDLGGTKIQTVVIDGRAKVLGQARRPTPTTGGPEDVAEAMAEAMRDAASDAGIEAAALSGVGIGSPGDVDARNGVVSRARNLPGWNGSFELAAWLGDALRVPVRVGNDVTLATDAEARLGAGRPYKSLIGVFWGSGVGGGIILDGKPWLGRGGAGEIGHIVVKRGGARCGCGRRGCLEAYAGRAAMEAKARREHAAGRKTDLFKLMEKHGRDRLTSGIWQRALDAEDPLAVELMDQAVKALGAGVASVINLLDLEAVIIGGGIGVRLGEPYAARIEKQMHKHLFNADRPPAVHVASLGDLGGAIGAARLVSGRRRRDPGRAPRRPRGARRTASAASGSS